MMDQNYLCFYFKDSQKSYILIGSDDFAISLDGYNKSPGPLDIGNWWFNATFRNLLEGIWGMDKFL